MHLNRFRLVAATLVMGVALTACAPQPSTPPQSGACQSMALLQASFVAFGELDPATANSGDYLAVWSAGRQYYIDLQDYLDQIAFEQASAVEEAMGDLEEAVNDLPDDATPEEAVAAVQPEIDAAQAALDSAESGLDCGSS